MIFTKFGYRFFFNHGSEGYYIYMEVDGEWRLVWTNTGACDSAIPLPEEFNV